MNRIEKKFKELKRIRKKAFIAFITAGFPNLGITEKLVFEFSRIGVDIIELGVPFSDPMADGPIIQGASEVALKNGINLYRILSLVKRARRRTDTPICLMTYYNPIFCFGEEKFLRAAKLAGVDGVIIPDLPPEEGRPFIKLANGQDIDVICFIAPTTTAARIKYISAIAKGFIYYLSLTGVTGPRRKLPAGLARRLIYIKNTAKKPVCVGFGVSTPKQVRDIQRIADGVIVGSAIVKKIKEGIGKPNLINKVVSFVEDLKG